MSETPPMARVGGPLDEVNDAFHELYDRQRSVAESDPILVMLADDLILIDGDTRRTFRVTTDEFTAAKSVAHGPVALWLVLQAPDSAARRERVAALRARLEKSPPSSILADTLRWMERIPFDLDAFGKAMGRPLLDAIAHATKVQLDALHRATEEALATLSTEAARRLHVAVTGDHQARARSLPMQYFGKRFADPDRVIYAEGVTDADEAAALVGKQRLDREMAKAFFGDPQRLQRDVLGDAAKAELEQASFERIDA